MNRTRIIILIVVSLLTLVSLSEAAELCVSGVKGTLTSQYTVKLAHATNTERSITLLDQNKNVLFTSRAQNHFTQFNSTGYGACSITGESKEPGQVQYKLELKVLAHTKADCAAVDLPAYSDYFTLKIIPKGTTLGDDLTAYALTSGTCNN